MSLDPSTTIKALGIYWDPKSDSILYTVNVLESRESETKRSMLSQCAKLFDPLGLVGPVIVVGKIFIQQLWKHKMGWDDPVPADLHEAWSEYKKSARLAGTFSPRAAHFARKFERA